jgi:hypothetical protein
LLTGRTPSLGSQTWITVSFFIIGLLLAREAAGHILDGDMSFLEFAAAGAVGCAIVIAILRNWRLGFYLFNIWLMFEDLFRKYMGNGLALFFGKDILAAIIYFCLYSAIRRRKEKPFRPPFLLWFTLSLFVWVGAIQIFNPNSPSVIFGLLGFKLDFYYVPMMFVGYALVRSRDELRKFLVVNVIIGFVICSVGIIQAIVGNTFLNPAGLAPELRGLGDLEKVTPISGQVFSLPPSVFVSTGRYALYLTLAAMLAIGTAGYLLLYTKRSRKLVFFATGAIGAATLLSGSRTAVVDVIASTCVLTVGLLWGAPWKWQQGRRMVKAIRLSFTMAALGLALAVLLFPQAVGSRLAFYTETLNPYSSASELLSRGWTYPISNFLAVFQNPSWILGNGIGTASVGTQYVSRFLGTHYTAQWTEEGYGQLILELGIVGPLLWLLWSGSLLYCCWKIVRQLRQTMFSPIAFAIVWYAFVLLYPLTFGGTTAYQNYVNNVFLWLLIGILFRLPEIAATPEEREQVLPAQVGALARRRRHFWDTRPIVQPVTAFGEKLSD